MLLALDKMVLLHSLKTVLKLSQYQISLINKLLPKLLEKIVISVQTMIKHYFLKEL